MARWRAVNSSFMATSVVRPLAVAHGGHLIQIKHLDEKRGANGARATVRCLRDALAVHAVENSAMRWRKHIGDPLSVRRRPSCEQLVVTPAVLREGVPIRVELVAVDLDDDLALGPEE